VAYSAGHPEDVATKLALLQEKKPGHSGERAQPNPRISRTCSDGHESGIENSGQENNDFHGLRSLPTDPTSYDVFRHIWWVFVRLKKHKKQQKL
jgi:hypothetical protein